MVFAVTLTACSGAANTAGTLNGTPSAAPGTSSSRAPETPTGTAERAALAKIREFYVTWGRLESDLTAPVESFDQTLGQPLADKMKATVLQHRSALARGQGAYRVVSGKLTHATLPRDAQGKPIPGAAAVVARVCVDHSGWDLKLPNGNSALARDRPQTSRFTFTVRNPQWPRDDGWRVTGQDDPGNQPCDKN